MRQTSHAFHVGAEWRRRWYRRRRRVGLPSGERGRGPVDRVGLRCRTNRAGHADVEQRRQRLQRGQRGTAAAATAAAAQAKDVVVRAPAPRSAVVAKTPPSPISPAQPVIGLDQQPELLHERRRFGGRFDVFLNGFTATAPRTLLYYISVQGRREIISLFDERVGLRCAWNLTEISRRPEGPISAGFDGRVLVSAQSYSLRVVLHSRVRGNYNTPAPYIPRLPVSPVLAPDALTPSSYLTPSYLIGTVPNRGIYSVHYNMIYILDFSMLRYFFSKYTKMTKYTSRWLTNQ